MAAQMFLWMEQIQSESENPGDGIVEVRRVGKIVTGMDSFKVFSKAFVVILDTVKSPVYTPRRIEAVLFRP